MKTNVLPLAALLCAGAFPSYADVNDVEISALYGQGFSSNLERVDTGNELDTSSADSYALTLNILSKTKPGAVLQYEFYAANFDTDISTKGSDPQKLPMDVSYLHFGGTYEWPLQANFRPYLALTVGASYFNPKAADDEIRPSMGIAGGLKWYLTDNIALKAEVRSLGSVMSGNRQIYCGDDGCQVAVSSSLWWHTMAGAGITIGF